MNKGLILLVISRLLSTSSEHNNKPNWIKFGQLAVCLSHAQASASRHFLTSCYTSNMFLSPVFGLNFYSIGGNHVGCLRILLLVAGDVERSPGPIDNPNDQSTEPTNRLQCSECQATFGQQKNLNAHVKNVHGLQSRSCTHGGCSFSTPYNFSLKRHLESHEKVHTPKRAKTQPNIERDVKNVVDGLIDRVEKLADRKNRNKESALKGRLRTVEIPGLGVDPMIFLTKSTPEIMGEVEAQLLTYTGVKRQLMVGVKFFKPTSPEDTTTSYFWSKPTPIYRGTEYTLTNETSQILTKIEEYQREGSGWVIEKIIRLEIHLSKCQPLRGSTYVRLPLYLYNKKAIINVKNNDQKCFLWSVLANTHPTTANAERVSKYVAFENDFNMTGIEYPVDLRSIDKFELQNDISINVYGYEEVIYPLRVSKKLNSLRHIHLLLYEEHYCLIKDLNRLLYDQTKHARRKFFCPRCLIPSTTMELLNKHLELCSTKKPTRIVMPEDTELKFKNINRQLRQPLVVYADFECLLKTVSDESESDDDKGSSTMKTQHHEPCGYGLIESRNCCGKPNFNDPTVCRGPKTIERFLTDVVGIAVKHQKTMNNQKEIGQVDKLKQMGSACHICGDKIVENKVRDHCHLCGRYRGPAHRECNSGYRLNRDVVLVFHNLRKYDGHLIMQEIGSCAKLHGYDIEVIAKAMEDYISFSLVHKKEQEAGGSKDFSYQIKFIDSLQFLNSSLSGLVNNLEKDQFHAMSTQFNENELPLLLRKGVYPYDFMDDWKKFNEVLPSKAEFYNALNDENITDDDYNHAKRVWNHFDHRNMGDYHDLYLKTDVLLLADVFEGFRTFCLDKYGLDPCHYVTTPSLAWDACLKMSGVKLQLLTDVDMYLFCENGIRGGISMISHRYAEANNPYLPSYDQTKPHSYIMYWDANNLYGWAMVQKLPVDGFQWIEDAEKDQDWKNIDTEGDQGYILEVDLDYPEELHDSHDKYPLAPESMIISDASPYCQQLKESMNITVPPQRKLVPNLSGRRRYIVHFRNLKLYLHLGRTFHMQGETTCRVRHILRFNQRRWMEPYIMFNTRMRAQATSEFEKNLLKLFNNAVFGKTMENVRKYKNVELISSTILFEKRVANNRYERSCRFNENLVGFAMLKLTTTLCKPIYCGLAVLDMSKELIYRFNYHYIMPKYGNCATLLFTDTDSLCYLIETDNIYYDMKQDSDQFDFSDYPKDHFLHSTLNKKVIGKMKDELSSVPIQAFCGLRPKMYALLPEKKRAKGIKKNIVKKMSFQDYVDTLFDETFRRHSMTFIRSHKHELFTERIRKKGLCAYDDKRWLLDKVVSRSRGHYKNTD